MIYLRLYDSIQLDHDKYIIIINYILCLSIQYHINRQPCYGITLYDILFNKDICIDIYVLV